MKSPAPIPFKFRLASARTKKTGFFWKGHPVRVRYVNIEICKNEDKPMYWGNAFVGQIRQGIQVFMPGGGSFIIDNEDGTGSAKLIQGKGSPAIFHRGILSGFIRSEVLESERKTFDIARYNETEKAITLYAKEVNPQWYEAQLKQREKDESSFW